MTAGVRGRPLLISALLVAAGGLTGAAWLSGHLLLAGVLALVSAAGGALLIRRWIAAALQELAQHLSAGGDAQELNDVRDLTERVRSFNQLTEELEQTMTALAVERDRFGAVLEGMGEAVIALDARRRITLVNQTAMRLFAPPWPPLGRPLRDLVHSAEVRDAVRASLQGEVHTVAFDHTSREPRRILATVTPQQQDHGCVLVCRDVTALKHLERMRQDFVANVSHELRTPVTIIQANAETLISGALSDPEHAPRFVDGIYRNAARLSRLIADLLDLSRIEAGRYPLTVQRLPLAPHIRQSIIALRQRAADRQQELIEQLDPACVACFDPGALEQVLTNLLDNAIKYGPPSSRITVRAQRQHGSVRVEIEDDGPGIAADHQARLFERFYRVDPGRSKEMGGTGLGLSIVKHLVESMGGRVGVRSAPPHGTTFWFVLRDAQEAPLRREE